MRNVSAPTVLLLDETTDSATCTETKDWLQNLGYNVKRVNCLTDAIESTIDYTLDSRPSLILLDFGQVSDISDDNLRFLQDITDFEDVPLVALSESAEKLSGDKMWTIENLEALQPLMKSLLSRSYAKAA